MGLDPPCSKRDRLPLPLQFSGSSSRTVLLTLPDIPLRTTSFSVEDRWLLWSRIDLYPDRLELLGWALDGRHHRRIPLEQIEETDYGNQRLLLDLTDDERVALRLEEPARWARFIQTHREVRDASS